MSDTETDNHEVDVQKSKVEPIASTEGWTIIVTGLNEEVREEDVRDQFADYGDISELHLPLARATGFVKGYALIKYKTQESAKKAITALNGKKWMEKEMVVDWAFLKGPFISSK